VHDVYFFIDFNILSIFKACALCIAEAFFNSADIDFNFLVSILICVHCL